MQMTWVADIGLSSGVPLSAVPLSAVVSPFLLPFTPVWHLLAGQTWPGIMMWTMNPSSSPDALPAASAEAILDWRQYYFVGVSEDLPSSIELGPGQIAALLSNVGAEASLACGTPLDPKVVINAKGTSVWALLFLIPFSDNKASLVDASQGKCCVCAPPSAVRRNYDSYINWPASLLTRYPLEIQDRHLFVLPFLRHKQLPAPRPMRQWLKTPDGKMAIINCYELNDLDPEGLLRNLSAVRKWLLSGAMQ